MTKKDLAFKSLLDLCFYAFMIRFFRFVESQFIIGEKIHTKVLLCLEGGVLELLYLGKAWVRGLLGETRK